MNRLSVVALLLVTSQVYADYKGDIGYTLLEIELGSGIPDGSWVVVTQVEAAIGETETDVGAWMPDVTSSQFSGKTILDQSNPLSNGVSSHATGVGGLFYGNDSMASGITNIDVYSASDWLINGFLKTGSNSQPLISSSRIANHSWVGEMDIPENSAQVLRRVDWLVEEQEFIQVVAMNNGSNNRTLLGSAYNSIAAGRTDTLHAQGSIGLDSVYTEGRTRPDVVVPVAATSSATPVASAAAALLIEQAHSAAQGSTAIISNGDSIYNGERSEVVKAVIMAGADRITDNSSTTAQISDYRENALNQTANGLDSRFGAGQLNVLNNYQIMDGGEQDSLQDGGATTIGMMGYDYDESFGGSQGSNNSASYLFETTQLDGLQLTASLVWNLDIEDNVNGPSFNPVAKLFNLDLFLYDVTEDGQSLLASSESAIDNTENLWFFLEAGRDYQLVVEAIGDSFNWDYALAWRVAPVPMPAAVWLFISGLLFLLGFSRDRERMIA